MTRDVVLASWLSSKTSEIAKKVDKEKFSTEDMVVLSLEAQSDEMKEGFSKVQQQFELVYAEFREINKKFELVDKKFDAVDKRFDVVEHRIDRLRDETRQEFAKVDLRLDRHLELMKWGFGLVITVTLASNLFRPFIG